MTQTSDLVIPPLAPPSRRELSGKEVSSLERSYWMVWALTCFSSLILVRASWAQQMAVCWYRSVW
jgi:hypothetical protein